MSVIESHPDPSLRLALLGLLVLGPLGYAVVARWRAALVPVAILAGVLAWVRLPLLVEPLAYVRTSPVPGAMRHWWLDVALEAAFLVWAVGLAGMAYTRHDTRMTT